MTLKRTDRGADMHHPKGTTVSGRLFFPWLICLAAHCAARPDTLLSLREAVDIATQHNDKIIQYEHRLGQRSSEVKGALGAFFPTATLSASYNVLKEPLVIDLDPIREALLATEASDQVNFAGIASQMKGGAAINDPTSPLYAAYYQKAYQSLDGSIPHFLDTLKPRKYPSAQLTIVQPLFTGGRLLAAQKAARDEKKTADVELRKIKNEIIRDVAVGYWAVSLEKEIFTVRSEVVDAMLHHRRDAEKLMAQGVIVKYQLLRADVAVSEARRAIYDDSVKLAIATLALHTVLSDGQTGPIDIVDSLRYRPVEDSVDCYLRMAQKSQPILMIMGEKKDLAHQKTLAMRGAFLPQIAAFGKMELFQDDLSVLEPPWIVGITATLDLFSGAKTFASLRASRQLESEVEALDQNARHDIFLWIEKSYMEMRRAEHRYLALASDCTLAGETSRQCKSRFVSGYGTSLEVIDANLTVERNRIERLVSLYDYYKSMAELFTAAGNPQALIDFISLKGD
jgi:outer membrane protein